MSPTPVRGVVWGLTLTLLVVPGGCGGEPGSGGASSSNAPPGKLDVTDSEVSEEQLASLDEKSPIVERRTVRRFGFLLDRLQRQCKGRRAQLADFTVTTQQRLDETKGVKQSLREILEAVTRAAPAAPGQRCRDLFVLYFATAGEP